MVAPSEVTEETVLNAVRTLASKTGSTPGKKAFANLTGISEGQWSRWWPRWNDLVVAAGLEPNERTPRTDEHESLRQIARLALVLGRVPARADIRIARRDNEALPGDGVAGRLLEGGRLGDRLRELVDEIPELEEIVGSPTEPPVEVGQIGGYVYLLRSGNHYKIGATTDVLRREGELQIAVPGGVTPIHHLATDDPYGIEAYWHRRFAQQRTNGEWFLLDRNDVIAFTSRGDYM